MTRHEMRRQWREDNLTLQARGLHAQTFQMWFELKLVAEKIAGDRATSQTKPTATLD